MIDDVAKANAFLEPGGVLVNREATTITAVVGSAVAVTLWDRENRFGGMCHFIFPEMHDKEKTTVKYGNVAIYALLKTMKEFGAEMKNLEAQIFGGAEPLDIESGKSTAASENVDVAHNSLRRYKIRITSADTGGHVGRKIAFNTMKNEVLVYRVEKLRQEDWHFV